jgi:hypothetical protein
MLKKFFSKKSNRYLILFVGLFIIASFFIGDYASASTLSKAVAAILCWIIYGIIWVLGKVLVLIMWVLITLAQYNDFIHAAPITFGWVIVRDVCNMFFILILLIIAFGTILRIPQYNFKTLLPKLIIMAILINFSKLICGIFIDFAQVIMLTFVNGFKDVGEGNLFNMLGLEGLMNMDTGGGGTEEVSEWSILGTYILALLFVIIALITLISMVSMLAMRIIMMWIYVVLSPLAYLLGAFPQGQKYASQWWDKFSRNLIVGPVLAFFVWLAFASLGGVGNSNDVNTIVASNTKTQGAVMESSDYGGSATASTSMPQAGISQAGSGDQMIKFIISIAMLIGGLQIAQEIGGEAGAAAGKGIARLQSMKAGTLKAGKRIAVGAGRRVAAGAVGTAGVAFKGAGALMGGQQTMAGRALQSFGAVGTGWRKDMVTSRKKRAVEARQKFFEKMGMGENAGEAGAAFTGSVKKRLNFGEQLGKRADRRRAERKTNNIEEGGRLIDDGKKLEAEGLNDKKMYGAETGKMMKDGMEEQDYGKKLTAEAQTKIDAKTARLDILNSTPKTGDVDYDKEVEFEKGQIQEDLKKLTDDKKFGEQMTKEGGDKWQKAKAIEDDAKNGFAVANGKIDKGKAMQNDGKAMQEKGEKLGEKGSFINSTAFGKKIKSSLNLGDVVTEPSHKAFKKMSVEAQNANRFVDNIGKDESFMRDASASEFCGASSMNSQQKKNLQKINEDPRAVKSLVDQLNSWNKSGDSPDKLINITRAISKALNGYEKSGEDTTNLKPLKDFVNSMVSQVREPNKLKGPDGYNISYSDRGHQRIDGQGEFDAKRFNDNARTTGNKVLSENSIKVDFSELKDLKGFGGSEFKENADAANLGPDQIKEFVSHLESKLQSLKPEDKSYQGMLTAINNLKNNKVNVLSLRNSGVSKGFRGDLSAEYHENTHKGGVKDESLARGLEELMMNMRLTGKDTGTGENHSLEIGKLAAALEGKGVASGDILKQMEGEITKRGGSQAFLQPAPVNVDLKGVLAGGTGATVINNITNVNNVSNVTNVAGGDNKKETDKVLKEVGAIKKGQVNLAKGQANIGKTQIKGQRVQQAVNLTAARNIKGIKSAQGKIEKSIKDTLANNAVNAGNVDNEERASATQESNPAEEEKV